MKLQQETITELQELTNSYRLKISMLDENNQRLIDENIAAKKVNEQLQKNWDIDKVSLQHELQDLRKRFVDQRTKYDTLDEQHKTISKLYKDILAVVETLGKDLNIEREKNRDLESKIYKDGLDNETEKDLKIIIQDLKDENLLLQKEMAKFMENRFATHRDKEFQDEIQTLKDKISELEKQILTMGDANSTLRQQLIDLNGTCY